MRRRDVRAAFAFVLVFSAAWFACSSFESDPTAPPAEGGAGETNDAAASETESDTSTDAGVDATVEFCADAGPNLFCADFEVASFVAGWSGTEISGGGDGGLSTAYAVSPIRSFRAEAPNSGSVARLVKYLATMDGYQIEVAFLISSDSTVGSVMMVLVPRKDINIRFIITPDTSSSRLIVERPRFDGGVAFAPQLGALLLPNTWHRLRIQVPSTTADASTAEDAQATRVQLLTSNGDDAGRVDVPMTGAAHTANPPPHVDIGANNSAAKDAGTVVVHYDNFILRAN